MVRWHHQLYGHELEQAPGTAEGQRSLVCCSPWGWTQLSNWSELNWTDNWYNTKHSQTLFLLCITHNLIYFWQQSSLPIEICLKSVTSIYFSLWFFLYLKLFTNGFWIMLNFYLTIVNSGTVDPVVHTPYRVIWFHKLITLKTNRPNICIIWILINIHVFRKYYLSFSAPIMSENISSNSGQMSFLVY